MESARRPALEGRFAFARVPHAMDDVGAVAPVLQHPEQDLGRIPQVGVDDGTDESKARARDLAGHGTDAAVRLENDGLLVETKQGTTTDGGARPVAGTAVPAVIPAEKG